MEEKPVLETIRKFKPHNCVFVISVDENNKPSGMVAAWQMRCSSEPSLFAVSLSKGGNTKDLIRKSKEFVVAVPNGELEKEVRFFGSKHGNQVDKFKETGVGTLPAKHVKSPLIKNATFNFECKLVQEVDSGDHIIFIGEVVAAYHNENKKVLLSYGKVNGERVFKEI